MLVALMVALVVALPLSLLLFSKLRRELDQALAESGQRRKAQKARLRAQLTGLAEAPDGSVGDGSAGERSAGDSGAAPDGAARDGSAGGGGAPDGSAGGGGAPDGAAGGGWSTQQGQPQADGGAEGPGQHDLAGVADQGDQVRPGDPAQHPPQR